jgi:outer membrane lipoprotein SlyB
MAFDMVMQAHAKNWEVHSIEDFDWGEVAFAGTAGAAGGAGGALFGGLVTGSLRTALGVTAAQFIGSVSGGMAGSHIAGLTYRGQVATKEGIQGKATFEDGIKMMFNGKSVVTDLSVGAAGGLLSFGVNQIVQQLSVARATKTPVQNAPRPNTAQTGQIGEIEAQNVSRTQGVSNTRGVQNASGHGLDPSGVANDGSSVLVNEAKASTGPQPPGLRKPQQNMPQYVQDKLNEALAPGSNYDAASQAHARAMLDAINRGVPVRGQVVETRFAGSPQQFTNTRPWTANTPARGPAMWQVPLPTTPTITPPLSILNPTCYSTDRNSSVRCDTTVIHF